MKHWITYTISVTLICALPLAASGTVASGAVRDQEGVPVAGARIVFTDEANPLAGFDDVTGLDGTYQIDLSSVPTALLAPGERGAPKRLQLLQNYPNPFNSSTIITYTIPAAGRATLDVYNVLGQRIRTLIDEHKEPGEHAIEWHGRNDHGEGMAAGVYIYRLRSGQLEAAGRMVMTDGAAATPNPGSAYAAPRPVLLAGDGGQLYTVTITGDNIETFSRTGVAVPAAAQWSDLPSALTPEQVQELLQISPARFDELVEDLPGSFKIGSQWRVLRDELRNMPLDFHVVRPLTSEPYSGTVYMKWVGVGGFFVWLGDVNFAFDPYLLGEDLETAEAVFDYIFISHEHYDHCDARTLTKLCQGPRFKKLFVSPGCLTPAQPIFESYGYAAFDYDLPIDKHIPRDMIQVVYPKHRRTPSEEFPGPQELDLGPIYVETLDSDERARSDLPTLGYLVTHRQKNLSFYHTGDLGRTFPEMSNLRDRVDFLIQCKIGLRNPSVMSTFLNYVLPRYFIPTHYRTDRTSDPVPYGYWPPDVTDVNAFIEDLRRQAGERTTIVPFTAGVLYEVELPSKQVNWKWEWHYPAIWDEVEVPPWAH